ncbi:MAG: hypothetical protein IT373_25710 [Polyangiaceae bacterium]|nr:hypothetical protein [Polyangiaceae bacterium]
MGRRKYRPDPLREIEHLTVDKYAVIQQAVRLGFAGSLDARWLDVQRARLRLAKAHLDAAEKLNAAGTKGKIDEIKRGVISRAYYAMFCAARAAVSYHLKQDVDGHEEVQKRLRQCVPLAGEARDRVIASLHVHRVCRNNADYSPFYPGLLGRDARVAITAAKATIRICELWLPPAAEGGEP